MTALGTRNGDADNVLRSSRTMALGTVASRATGFLRMVLLAATIGTLTLAEAYNVANVLPNILYELLLGGVLTSVVVPLLVAATKSDQDSGVPGPAGERYARQLLTLVVLFLGAATLIAMVAAPALLSLYGHVSGDQHDLAVTFARFFLPQILFLGIGAMIGAILNTRGRFGAPMWAPVLNNVVVIATLAVFLLQTLGKSRDDLLPLSTPQLLTLGIGTTAGIVVQTLALLPSLRATGFRLRPQLGLPLADLRRAGRLAGWVLVYVAANQLALLVVVRLARAAGTAADSGIGYSAYLYAFTIFSLPHAIVGVSIITALLPRMSRAALDDRLDRLRSDLAGGLRLAGVLVVPAAFALAVLGPLIGTVIYGHGRVGPVDGRAIGWVLAGFAVGLVPFSVFQLHLRAFYAQGDTRTPALVNVAVNAVNIAVALLAYATLPPQWRVVGLAVSYSMSYLVGAVLTSRLVARRLPDGPPEHVLRTYVRLAVAAVAGSAVAVTVALPLQAVLAAGRSAAGPLAAGVGLALAVPAGGAVYFRIARRLRVAEVTQLLDVLPAGIRLLRRSG